MNIQEALRVLKPQSSIIEALKQAYRQAARRYHPDLNPHGGELMKVVNSAYELLLSKIGEWDVNGDQAEADTESLSLDETMAEILNQVGHLPGLIIEVCGTWLWISGNTYPFRKELKAAGLSFASKKKAWFWRSPESKTSSRGEWSLDEIRERHGSMEVKSAQRNELAA